MSEKRKPAYTILLKKAGKKNNKIELFYASLWTQRYRENDFTGRDHFRLRINGKWWPDNKKEFFTKTKIKELLFRQIDSRGAGG